MPGHSTAPWMDPTVVDLADRDWPSLPVNPIVSALADLVEIHHAGGRILEIGCGTGRIYEALMRRLVLRPHGYTGIDVSPAMVSRAHARYPGVDFQVADVLALPFATGAYGSVVCVEVLQYFPEPAHPLSEVLGVAATHAFLQFPLGGEPSGGRWFGDFAHSDEQVIRACEAAGGRILDFHVMEDDARYFGLVRVGKR